MVSLLLGIIYLAFISLGLPDSLLGAAWPSMCLEFDVPVSYAGAVSVIISVGTIISSLMSDRITRRLGTGKVTAISVAMTALALFGFSVSDSYWILLLWAVPYGLGAGSVDASLNNYVALHYASRHMSWLHCMWGVGASVGPYILGYAMTSGQGWNMGYRYISFIQIALTAVLFISIPIWKKRPLSNDSGEKSVQSRALRLKEIVMIPGAKEILLAFFCYCAVEQTVGLWASTYLVRYLGMKEQQAASLASLFFIGITVGRAISGFLTYKLNDRNMIRLGQGIMVLGILVMLLPVNGVAMVGLILVGLGCAPIYPCVIHSTPEHFGAENAQALIGVQMASAYIGILVMPPVFGLIANHIHIGLFPYYLAVIMAVMIWMCERMNG